MLDLSLIRINGGTQSREKLNDEAVAEYAEAYKAGAKFPPVIVFYDGVDRWLADGFHRYWAAKAAGLNYILENITPGTRRDAVLYSLGANGKHGLNRTNADKRKAVETLLADSEWMQWSDREIARKCDVGAPFVGDVRRSICNPITDRPVARTVERNGKTYTQDTSNIGKEKQVLPEAAPEPAPEAEDPPEYSKLDAAHDQILDLQAELVISRMGDIPEDQKQQAAELISALHSEINTLNAANRALVISRDTFQNENAQMRRQMAMQRKEIERLKSAK